MLLKIREALTDDAEILTSIAFAAKRTWNYPEEYFQKWNTELTITKEYIKKNIVFVAEVNKICIGFYSLVCIQSDLNLEKILVEKGFWMDHLFIHPKNQYKGFGSILLKHALDYCVDNWVDELNVFVDPNAIGFYEKMGAVFIKKSASSIPNREVPIYRFVLSEND